MDQPRVQDSRRFAHGFDADLHPLFRRHRILAANIADGPNNVL